MITDFIIDSDDGEDIGEDNSVFNGLNESELQKLCDNLDSSHKNPQGQPSEKSSHKGQPS